MNKCGALMVTSDKTGQEAEVIKNLVNDCKKAGDTDAELLTKQELLDIEPLLSDKITFGANIPNEGVVEPFLVAIAHAFSAKLHGAKILTNSKVTEVNRYRSPEDESIVWAVSAKNMRKFWLRI